MVDREDLPERDERRGPDPSRGVYGISVAAELADLDPQSLRLYERRGLLEPERTPGGTRRYSQDDVDRLNRIGSLLDEGLNIAGVAAVLAVEDEHAELLSEHSRLQSDHAELTAENARLAAENARMRRRAGDDPGRDA